MNSLDIVQEKKCSFIICLKFVACLLILNSHCRDIYPFYFLALGGGHGNAIFFALSGFCLANIKFNFCCWFKKRILRILPVTLVVLFSGLVYNVASQRLCLDYDIVFHDVLNRYWFVWAILIYYVFFYFIIKNGNVKRTTTCLISFALGYVALYAFLYTKNTFFIELEGFSPIKVYFYFGVMLMGGLLRQLNEKVCRYVEKMNVFVLLGFILILGVVWVGEYASMFVWNKLYSLQFLIHLSICSFAALIILLGKKLDRYINVQNKLYNLLIVPIADATLEIYLIQVTFKALSLYFVFPTNWALFMIGSILLGKLAQICNSFFYRSIPNFFFNGSYQKK